MSPYDLLPSWPGVRDNLWTDLLIATPFGVTWLYARFISLPAFWQWVAFSLMELFLGLGGQAAVSHFGHIAVAPAFLVLALPVLLLYFLDKRKVRAASTATATKTPGASESEEVPDDQVVPALLQRLPGDQRGLLLALDLGEKVLPLDEPGLESLERNRLAQRLRHVERNRYLFRLHPANEGAIRALFHPQAPPAVTPQAVEEAVLRNDRADWEMRRNSAIHAIVAAYNKTMHHPDNAAQYLATAGSASAILWKMYTTEQERESGSQFHNAYTLILNATRDPATVSPERLHLAILDIARLANLTDLVLDPPSGQPAPADAQAKETEEKEQRQIEQERPSVDLLRVLHFAYLSKSIDYMTEVFSAEFTIHSRTVGYLTPEKTLICDLIGHYVYRELMAARNELDRRLANPPDRLSSIVTAFCAALTQYGIFLGYFNRQGAIIYTEDEFRSSAHYVEIYRRHQSLCEQLRLARPRGDIGRVAADITSLCRLLKRPSPLQVKAFVDPLSQSWDTHKPEERLTAGFLKREFVVLSVTNRTQKDLRNVVATCQFNNGSNEFCLWSSESGKRFVIGGRQAADLSVGDSTLMIVAQGIGGGEQWARVPSDQPFNLLVRGESGATTYLDNAGNVLTLCAGSALATVRFQAEGIDEKRSYRLTFSSEKKPQVSVIE